MVYINQRKYVDMIYPHNLDNGGVPEGKDTIAAAGCGLCSLCMVVEHLTQKQLPLEECIKLSCDNGANRKIGTSMRILGPIVAQMYDLAYAQTSSKEELIAHLQSGGEAIANVSGDRPGVRGLFTDGGHYMVVVSTDGQEAKILDPGYIPGMFDQDGRRGKVRLEDPFVFCTLDILIEEASNRNPSFYLFKRK